MSRSKCKSSSDVAVTAKKHQVITIETKVKIIEWSNRGRSNWRTEEGHDAGNGTGIFLFEEALLVFEAQNLDIERYTKAAAAIQIAIQCYCVIHDDKKKSYYPDITGLFSQEGR